MRIQRLAPAVLQFPKWETEVGCRNILSGDCEALTFFEDLTVREHLVFFGMLKGMTKSAAEDEGAKYISMLNLEPKKDVNVTTLSGGMKRKVNLGIALIGDSKVDEFDH